MSKVYADHIRRYLTSVLSLKNSYVYHATGYGLELDNNMVLDEKLKNFAEEINTTNLECHFGAERELRHKKMRVALIDTYSYYQSVRFKLLMESSLLYAASEPFCLARAATGRAINLLKELRSREREEEKVKEKEGLLLELERERAEATSAELLKLLEDRNKALASYANEHSALANACSPTQ